MKATFFCVAIFPPPPPSGADVFAGGDCPGAGGAADARVELVVQGVVGNAVLLDVGPDFLLAPFGERVEFLEARCLRRAHAVRDFRSTPDSGHIASSTTWRIIKP